MLLQTVLRTRTPLRTTMMKTASYSALRVQPTAKSVASQTEQAPNRLDTWAPDQRPKKDALVGPRFEQTDLSTQPNPMAAIDLIAEEPIRIVNQRIVSCDGGDAALGHPKVYINLDKPGAHACGYCGIRFQKPEDHHH
ncbi:zinc-finger domain-containing protein [Halteromyces radiatus]|uniref:zinc-finger domain-containing protein n=1 Tax=Halteromyces radiatus TaxID=101107 RepID=UPI0022200E31|nr:zinc-finger domain-containing protein [Halteromyces radiatus]KAI8099770.1 zinc-finger domain-containing protein [Halteromyces radiatus]